VQIPGADDLIKVFGRWPSFHDSEVVRFVLERAEPVGAGPNITANVHVFEMTDRIGSDGAYVLRNHTLVSFRFAGVDQVVLEEFNNQNVLRDFAITDIRDRQLEGLKYEINFASSFGMGARFLCREVTSRACGPGKGVRRCRLRRTAHAPPLMLSVSRHRASLQTTVEPSATCLPVVRHPKTTTGAMRARRSRCGFVLKWMFVNSS
jgi:hypothetical protein